MRTLRWAFAVFTLSTATAIGQAPTSPMLPAGAAPKTSDAKVELPPPPPMSERNAKSLDYLLKLWEDRMSKVQSLETKCVQTEVTSENGKEERRVSTGPAALMKPNYASLLLKDVADPGNPKRIRHFIADGKIQWEYNYAKKVAVVDQLPAAGFKHTLIDFLIGMKAEEIKSRYYVSVDVDDPKRYNEFYLHISIFPKYASDLKEFSKAELVLWKKEKDPKYADMWMLPARLWYQNANKDQVIWEFKEMSTQTKLTAASFAAVPFPDKTWRSEWRTPPAPEVVRPVSGGKK